MLYWVIRGVVYCVSCSRFSVLNLCLCSNFVMERSKKFYAIVVFVFASVGSEGTQQ